MRYKVTNDIEVGTTINKILIKQDDDIICIDKEDVPKLIEALQQQLKTGWILEWVPEDANV